MFKKIHIFALFFIILNNYSDAKPGKDLSDYFPNPYRLQLNFLDRKNPEKNAHLRYEKAMISFFDFNCRAGSQRYCDLKNKALNLKSRRDQILSKVEDGSLSIEGNNLVSSLMSLGFEFDFLLSEEEIEKDVTDIISFIHDKDQLQSEYLFAIKSIPVYNVQSSFFTSTIQPLLFSQILNNNPLDAFVLFLGEAECHNKQKVCAHYFYQMYVDYKEIKSRYESFIRKKLDTAISHLLKQDKEFVASLEERQWLLSIYNAYTQKDFSYLYDLASSGAGYSNDTQRTFKRLCIEIFIQNELFDKYDDIIEAKALKWRSTVEASRSTLNSYQDNNPARAELLETLNRQIILFKEKTLKKLETLDDEIIYKTGEENEVPLS